MKGVIYTRVSSDEQVDGTSLASQDELCRDYCKKKGIEVAEAFREEGQSAKDLSMKNRSRFLAALEFCRQRKDIGAFVVFKVDRFARSTEDHFAVRRILRGYGVTLYSVTEPIGDKPAEKFIETVLAGAAEYDNAIRKERCTGGMIARINQGIWPFRPPVGYLCAGHKRRGEKKTVPDQPHAVLFPLIQRALRAYASGELLSQAAVTRQLNLWGFAAANGKPAVNQLVNSMLTKHLPFYAGKIVSPWTQREHPGLHVPMISEADCARIRARRLGKLDPLPVQRTRFNANFPLRRLLRCTSCSRFLTAAACVGRGGTYSYYYCINKACSLRSKGLREDVIRPRFSSYLYKLAGRAGEPTEIEGRVRSIIEARAGRPQLERDTRAKRRADLTEKRRRICEMREDGTYDEHLFRERLLAIDQELAAFNPEPESPHDLASVDPRELAASIRWLIPRLALCWEKLPAPSRLRFERIVFPDGVRYDPNGEFRTTKPGLIFALFAAKATAESTTVDLSGFSSNHLCEYFEELVEFYHEMKDTTPEQADIIRPCK